MVQQERENNLRRLGRSLREHWARSTAVGLLVVGGVGEVVRGGEDIRNFGNVLAGIGRPASATPTEGARLVAAATATPFVKELLAEPTPTATVIPEVARWQRLEDLDRVFRTEGLEAWLRRAGFSWGSLQVVARQIEEETDPRGRIFASGVQVEARGLRAPWPNCITTDQAVPAGPDTRSHQPDPRNPSRLWTEVLNFDGRATLYVDCSNWSQLQPRR